MAILGRQTSYHESVTISCICSGIRVDEANPSNFAGLAT